LLIKGRAARLAANNKQEIIMGKGMNQKKEVKKPKKEKPKTSPAAVRGK
jgi:hypothetical protein